MTQITQEQLASLTALLQANDRGGFYLEYYRITGSEQALIQGQVSTYSGFWGKSQTT